ncbi:ATP-dependent DNA helicase [Bathymodiolus heckerae thiotrophic gill symbiont]|uniref:Fic family protein n=1 Tax=Bathymodiolus heckerae thiotrophic gill symbiont TaxID=1052212 RepID=UPI0010BC8444|nr:hypothetical protein [Bathymodiolus heckerae thiotrophic gill symbiont]CAC9457766.1 hypothetical protein [uncultured Gammaproteobacteria bacterium]SMN13430.1 ATP-dependent DNA helicase [Bathymodiolus heckerae thiotrophic gill symbiont]SMN16695.1 ATP-dependent DNA helicase [uncultured Candidatus Thioglobus sp.]
MNLFRRSKKNKNQRKDLDSEKVNNPETIEESSKTFKRNIINKTGKVQQNFDFKENPDLIRIETINGTKKGLSINKAKISQSQINILKKCKQENTAVELIKILKRSNKTKFKQTILTPLVELGFFELTLPEKPTSPNQKYRLTGKFVKKNLKP